MEAYKGRDILEIPKGISSRAFKKKVRSWVRLYDLHGPDVLKHKGQNTMRTPEEKMTIVAEALAGINVNNKTTKNVAENFTNFDYLVCSSLLCGKMSFVR